VLYHCLSGINILGLSLDFLLLWFVVIFKCILINVSLSLLELINMLV